MKLVIFGLTVSSSWGNGHATLWRGLCRELAKRGHDVVFFERDVAYYASHRDLHALPGGSLVLYPDFESAVPLARRHLAQADVAIVTSYCPDAVDFTDVVIESNVALRVFYDLDTPVTLAAVAAGRTVDYVGPRGLSDFDLVLSFTGGKALTELTRVLGARRTAVLYGSVDPSLHGPVPTMDRYRCDLSYLGTYAEDRQAMLDRLFVSPAHLLRTRSFLLGGSQYPDNFPWADNMSYVRHVQPPEHPAFFCSSRLTLNVTRRMMAEMGYCPSGRLFEAAACGVPIVTDAWEGMERFFTPGEQIIVARTTEDVVQALSLDDRERLRISRAARERTLDEHTAGVRVTELERVLDHTQAAVLAGLLQMPQPAALAAPESPPPPLVGPEPAVALAAPEIQRCSA
jgi:spore maturation protein CgeB